MQFLHEHPWLLAVAIFAIRVSDVSLGTLRTIMVFRGFRGLAALVAFGEVLLWLVAVGQVLHNLDRWYLAVAYAAGFATGNYVGMWIDTKLALGSEMVRAISANPEIDLADRLRLARFDVTALQGRREGGKPVEVLLVVEGRRHVPRLLRLIHETDPDALCTLSDVRHPGRPLLRRQRRRGGLGGGWRAIGKRK
jgi:uncharacterized protein YebE (UPF0316 family)